MLPDYKPQNQVWRVIFLFEMLKRMFHLSFSCSLLERQLSISPGCSAEVAFAISISGMLKIVGLKCFLEN